MAIMVVFCVARVMTMALVPAVRPLQTMHLFIWWCKASLHRDLPAAQPMAAESSKTVLQHLIGNRLSGCCGMEGCKTHVLLLWWWAAAVNIADSGSCYISKPRQRAYAAVKTSVLQGVQVHCWAMWHQGFGGHHTWRPYEKVSGGAT